MRHGFNLDVAKTTASAVRAWLVDEFASITIMTGVTSRGWTGRINYLWYIIYTHVWTSLCSACVGIQKMAVWDEGVCTLDGKLVRSRA